MTFTEKYFLEEIVRLRQLFSDKTWWAKTEEQRDNCLKGLSLVYLNIENEDGSKVTSAQIEKWANIFESTMVEYEQRKTMLILHPPTPQNGNWKSIVWWDKKQTGEAKTEDTHPTEAAARAVCQQLKSHGWGGEGHFYPVIAFVDSPTGERLTIS